MTVTILSVTAANGGAEVRLRIELREGEQKECRTLALLTCQYAALRPQKGEISQEEFDRLCVQAKICEAVVRGMGLLSYGACSVRGMEMKLRSRGYDARIARSAAAYLSRNGYICEAEDAAREAERCLKKHWGKKRIAASLLEKGYGDDAIGKALATLCEEDLLDSCYAAARKKCPKPPQTPEEKQKAYATLCRLGFTPDQIRFALQQLAAEHDEV